MERARTWLDVQETNAFASMPNRMNKRQHVLVMVYFFRAVHRNKAAVIATQPLIFFSAFGAGLVRLK